MLSPRAWGHYLIYTYDGSCNKENITSKRRVGINVWVRQFGQQWYCAISLQCCISQTWTIAVLFLLTSYMVRWWRAMIQRASQFYYIFLVRFGHNKQSRSLPPCAVSRFYVFRTKEIGDSEWSSNWQKNGVGTLCWILSSHVPYDCLVTIFHVLSSLSQFPFVGWRGKKCK